MNSLICGRRTGALFAVVLCLFLMYNVDARADQASQDYVLAVKAARQGDYDAAFMQFRAVLSHGSDSMHREEALFAVAEYYHLKGIYTQAPQILTEFLDRYPSSGKRIFVLAFLLEVAEQGDQEELAERLRQYIVTMRQVSLLFRESQEYALLSPLQRNLKVVYYIDKVEFYADEELFKSIPY